MNMKSKLAYSFLFLCIVASLLLTACGGLVSGGIQLPGASSGDSNGGSPTIQDNTLIYVLIAAVVLVALVALLKR